MPGLFPNGFSINSRPTLAVVTALISTADIIAQLRIAKATDQPASALDPNAKGSELAKRFIKDWVEAKVARIVYTGQAPRDVALAVKPFEDARDASLLYIDALGEQAQDVAGTPFDKVRGTDGSIARDLLVTDATLGAGARGGSALKPF